MYLCGDELRYITAAGDFSEMELLDRVSRTHARAHAEMYVRAHVYVHVRKLVRACAYVCVSLSIIISSGRKLGQIDTAFDIYIECSR